jgi:hypothetical protein
MEDGFCFFGKVAFVYEVAFSHQVVRRHRGLDNVTVMIDAASGIAFDNELRAKGRIATEAVPPRE